MTERIKNIIAMFNELPPNRTEIEKDFAVNRFDEHEIAEITYEILSKCKGEYYDAAERGEGDINNLHSMYIRDSIQYLLEKGLDPNSFVNDYSDCIMHDVIWIDMPGVAPSVLKLLLEHGGNPNLKFSDSSETLFEYVTFGINVDVVERTELGDNFFCWLLLMAYGGCYDDGEIPLELLNGHDVHIFKDFERFNYKVEWIPRLKFSPE